MAYKQKKPVLVTEGGLNTTTLTSGQIVVGAGTSAPTGLNYTSSTSWTPVLQFGGASVGITYSTQTGVYWQVGKLVFLDLTIVLSSKGTSVGNATIVISGPPAAETTISSVPFKFTYSNIAFVGIPGGRLITSSLTLSGEDYRSNNSALSLTNTSFTNTSVVRVSGCYLAA
jgi:hypothetical protein